MATPQATSSSPPQNPLIQSYHAWSERTPFVTRVTTIALVVVYLLSFFFPLDSLLVNIPYFTVIRLQLYRLLFSSFVGNSLLNLIVLLLAFPALGLKMEASMGSTAFLCLLLTLHFLVNFSFLFVAFVASFLGVPAALGWECMDFWNLLFALLTMDCMLTPDVPRRLLCVPWEIPSKYLPLALFGFITLFGGFQVSYALAMLAGYAAHRGYLDRWKPSSQRCGAWESPNGPLHRLSRFRGYVLAGTLGQDAFIATNQSTIQAEREARQGLLSDHNRSAGASVHNGRGSSGGTLGGGGGKVGEQQLFPGAGHKLSAAGGGISIPIAAPVAAASREELVARRLAALEAGQLLSQPSAPPAPSNEAHH